MEHKRTDSTSEIPLTPFPLQQIPETAVVDPQQGRKNIGSYRAKAGKFSNTLSNLIPSISAKLHHGKTPVVETEASSISPDMTPQVIPVSNDYYTVAQGSFQQDLNMFLGADPTQQRTRQNTVSSQLSTSSFSMQPDIWSNKPSFYKNGSPEDELAQPQYQQYEQLAVPTNYTTWNRQRSASNASSLYTDASSYQPGAQAVQDMNSFRQPHPQGLLGDYAPSAVLVGDEIDPRSINWVTSQLDHTIPTTNQINSMLPTNTISISNVFPLQGSSGANNLTSTSLASLCASFGNVVSSRTLRGLNIALVEFDSVDSAVRARDALQGKEVSMVGVPSIVSFARILVPQPVSLLQEQVYSNQQLASLAGSQNTLNSGAVSYTHEKEVCPIVDPPKRLELIHTEILKVAMELGLQKTEQVTHILRNALHFEGTSDPSNFGPLPEPSLVREFDAPKLRELRKTIEANNMRKVEIEELAMAMMEELPELSSDYLGNTIVQKLTEHSSPVIKELMLQKVGPYLTQMGVHKNGTWACQKMISTADTPRQRMLIAQSLKDYCVPLFNDQFGNYVIQCCLKFGSPWNDFIFESIVANFWTITQSRYGARAVRACLEAHDVITVEQQAMLSAMIVLYAEYLTTNSNGALLITWFLDSCTFPRRHALLAPRIVSHIVELGTHRLASMTVLKMLNYRGDEQSKKIIVDAIFGSPSLNTALPQALCQILSDTSYGPTFIYKVLSMSILDGDEKTHAVSQVRRVLLDINVGAFPVYRRLLDEVGLSNGSKRNTVSSTDGHARNISVSSRNPRSRAHSGAQLHQLPGAYYQFDHQQTYTEVVGQFDQMSLGSQSQVYQPQYPEYH